MNMFKEFIDLYGYPESEEIFLLETTGRGSGNIDRAIMYMRKYHISEVEYLQKWKTIKEQIFSSKSDERSTLFNPLYETISTRGGTLFDEDDFNKIQSCLLSLGDKNLIIIEDNLYKSSDTPLFKMKFPSNISWMELNSGDFISVALLEMPKNNYSLFSESGIWGRYTPNEDFDPMDITGFLPEYKKMFVDVFLKNA